MTLEQEIEAWLLTEQIREEMELREFYRNLTVPDMMFLKHLKVGWTDEPIHQAA